jgi:hypothetical protein
MSHRRVALLLAVSLLTVSTAVLAARPAAEGSSQLDAVGVDPTVVTWPAMHPREPRMVYDVATGSLTDLLKNRGFENGQCLASGVNESRFVDSRPLPPPGEGYYYQVRVRSSCSEGTYGSATRDLHGMGSGQSCSGVAQQTPWVPFGNPDAFAKRCSMTFAD